MAATIGLSTLASSYSAVAVPRTPPILKHPLGKHRTLLHFAAAEEKDRQGGRPPTGLRKLVLLQRVRASTAKQIQAEAKLLARRAPPEGGRERLAPS